MTILDRIAGSQAHIAMILWNLELERDGPPKMLNIGCLCTEYRTFLKVTTP